ncbi:hypothetical protein A2U01_0053362, partial [Trifolium medium]|nr:hypothetical protein [Trifolium medium]
KWNIYALQKKTNLVGVYYNKGKPNLFRIQVDVKMAYLKHQLDLKDVYPAATKRVTNVEYHCPLVDSGGRVVSFTNMKLHKNDDVRTMFSIFS